MFLTFFNVCPRCTFLLIRSPFSFLILPQTVILLTSLLSPEELFLNLSCPSSSLWFYHQALVFHSPMSSFSTSENLASFGTIFFLHPRQLRALCQWSSLICWTQFPTRWQVTIESAPCSISFPSLLLGILEAWRGLCLLLYWFLTKHLVIIRDLLIIWGSKPPSLSSFLEWPKKFPLSLSFRLSFFLHRN